MLGYLTLSLRYLLIQLSRTKPNVSDKNMIKQKSHKKDHMTKIATNIVC